MFIQVVSHKAKDWLQHRSSISSAETIPTLDSAPSGASDLSERNMITLFAIVPGSSDSVSITVIGFPETSGKGVYLGEGTLNAKVPVTGGYTTDMLKIDTYGCKKFIAYITSASSFGTSGITMYYAEV